MSLSLWNDEQELPLQHLRIIDLTVMLPGPYLTRVLAQYGADVVKVECLPHGDPLRNVSDSAVFDLLNQGKRSVGIDLRDPKGVEMVRRLAGEADVFIENFREGVLDDMQLGYSELSEENPDLLYLSLRGFEGKRATQAGHDLNFIATSGCGQWYLESGIPNYSAQLGDIVGGMMMPALKLMFHLANPARRGMHLVSNMDEGFRSLYLPRAYDLFEQVKKTNLPKPFGLHHQTDGSKPHSRFYKCRDGQWLSLNAIQTKHWDTFCEVVDRNEWKSRWGDIELVSEVEKLFLDAPAAYWEALCANREVCLFRVIPWEEHLSFSQAKPQLSSDPLAWAGFAPNAGVRDCPRLGADTFSILTTMGYNNKEISDLLQSGIVFHPDGVKSK